MNTETTIQQEATTSTTGSFFNRHHVFFVCLVSLALVMLALTFPLYLKRRGYQSEKLTSMTSPVISAMRNVGAERLECNLNSEFILTVRSNVFVLREPGKFYVFCPMGLELDAIGGSARIIPLYGRTVRDTEKEFKRKSASDRQLEFHEVATLIVRQKSFYEREIMGREAFSRAQEVEATRARATWD